MNQNLLAVFHLSGGDYDHLTNTLFDDLALPVCDWLPDEEYTQGWTISKASLVKYILMRYGEQCCVIGDPEQMQEAIGYWSAINLPTWQALYKSIFLKYNPVRNMDYTITGTDDQTRTGSETKTSNRSDAASETHDDKDTFNDTHTDTVTYGKQENNSSNGVHTEAESSAGNVNTDTDNTTTKSIAAYNETTMTDSEKERLVGDADTASDAVKSNHNTDTKTGNVITSGQDIDADAHTGTIDYDRQFDRAGNASDIGTNIKNEHDYNENTKAYAGSMIKGDVVTALVSWREYRNVNMYDIIAKEFAKEFLIMIW